jgi:hypothetical protein
MNVRKSTAAAIRRATTIAVTGAIVGALVGSGSAALAATPHRGSRSAADQAMASGDSVLVSPKSVSVPRACKSVPLGESGTLAAVTLTVQTSARAAVVTIGSDRVRVPARSAQSRVDWIPVVRGRIHICGSPFARSVLEVLAHTGTPSRATPGGLVDVSARTPLDTSGRSRGEWKLPPDAIPAAASGLLVQISAASAGMVSIRAGGLKIPLAVGPDDSAATFVLPDSSLSWTRTSGVGAPSAIITGFVTAPGDTKDGGARLHLLPEPALVTSKSPTFGGHFGIPSASSTIPATGVLANLSGGPSLIADPLAQEAGTALGTQPGQIETGVLRLDDLGQVELSSEVHFGVVGWFSGDLVRAAKSIDLTRPGTPQPNGAPSKSQLTFAGSHLFSAGTALLIGNTKYTPGGLVAVVNSDRFAAGLTTVSYHQGSLMDAFSELAIVSRVPLEKPGPGSRAVAAQPFMRPDLTLPSFSLQQSVTLGKNPSVTGTVSLSFQPSVTLSVTINTASFLDIPDGIQIHYGLDDTSVLSASITASGTWSGQVTVPLAHIVLGAVDLGPVWISPELSAHLTLAVSASASVTIGGSITETAHDGMSLYGGVHGFSVDGDGNNGFSRPSASTSGPSAQVSAQASATISLQASFDIESVAGPDAQADATLAFNVNPGETPWWNLTASGDLSVGIDLDSLGISALSDALRILSIPSNPSWTIGHLGPYTVAAATGGTGGSTGGAGSGTTSGSSGGSPGPTGSGSGPGTVGGSSIGPVPSGSEAETDGGPSQTWSDYSDAGGTAGPTIATEQTVGVSCRVQGLPVHDGNVWWYQLSSSPWNGNYYVSADAFYNDGQTSGSLQGTPFYDRDVPLCQGQTGTGTSPAATGTAETAGSVVNTWTDYGDAGGSAGPGIATHQSVLVTCRLQGFAVADGNTWWYQIASSPWNDNYYASADAFYNNGAASGSLFGTPFYDPAVPVCASSSPPPPPPNTFGETTGSVTHTWTDYQDAGGNEGPSVPSNETVQISCRLQGFAVADGNTWWYQIASGPWSDSYYASADAFYNNGATSGSLQGTPFYDPGVPTC